jgi:CheY-like chemotaxis protein
MKRILFVDDDENIRLLYQEEFSDEGYQVHLAASGQEAIDKVRELEPDAVVMDIRMPGMNGLDAMSRIVGEFNTIPIVINSAYSHYKSDFSSWLADAYVIKSFDLTELKKAIQEVLERPEGQ